MELPLRVSSVVMVQYPAVVSEDKKQTEDDTYIIPTIHMKLQKILKLDDRFAYFKNDEKVERYRIPKIFIDKEVFVCEEYAPLRIAKEDDENIKREESE